VSPATLAEVQSHLVQGLSKYGCMTWAAASVLAEIGDASVVPALLHVFEDQDYQWRDWSQTGGYWDRGYKVADAVLAALQRIGTDAVPELLRALEYAEPTIRHAAARALGLIRPERAVPGLVRLLADRQEGMYFATQVCDEAAAALERIGTPDALEAVTRWHAAVLSGSDASKWNVDRSVAALERINSRPAKLALGRWRKCRQADNRARGQATQ
jgi:hypothetical protein